jgi:hypothetical protein
MNVRDGPRIGRLPGSEARGTSKNKAKRIFNGGFRLW